MFNTFFDYRKVEKQETYKPIVHCYKCKYKGEKNGKYIKCNWYKMLCEESSGCKAGILAAG